MSGLIALLVILATVVVTYLIYLGTGLQITELIVVAAGVALAGVALVVPRIAADRGRPGPSGEPGKPPRDGELAELRAIERSVDQSKSGRVGIDVVQKYHSILERLAARGVQATDLRIPDSNLEHDLLGENPITKTKRYAGDLSTPRDSFMLSLRLAIERIGLNPGTEN